MGKKVLKLFSVFVVTFAIIFAKVNALEITKSGDKVVQEGEYDSIRLVAGETVTNKADVDGLSFIAGNNLDLKGSTPYGFYAGSTVIVNEDVSKDMFVAGKNIEIGKDASLGRDVFAAGESIKIKSDVERDLRAAGESIDISGITIGGDAYVFFEDITMDEDTKIEGKLIYPENSEITGLKDADIGSTKVIKSDKKEDEEENSLAESVYDFIFSTLAAFVVMVVLLYLIPKAKEKLDNIELNASSIVKTSVKGIGVLILVPIIALIGLFTRILLPLSLIAIVVYIISIYLSSIVVAYIVGNILDEKFIKQENVYISALVGIVVLKLVELVPVIGGLVTAISLFYGLGLIFTFIKSKEKTATKKAKGKK